MRIGTRRAARPSGTTGAGGSALGSSANVRTCGSSVWMAAVERPLTWPRVATAALAGIACATARSATKINAPAPARPKTGRCMFSPAQKLRADRGHFGNSLMKRTVAVDANPLTRAVATGTELYARELARRLPGTIADVDWVFYASRPAAAATAAPDLTVMPMRRLWSQVRLPVELRRRRPDLFFAPAHVVPFAWRGPALTTVHDLAYERFPAAYGTAARIYLRATTRSAVRRCRLLLTVSESTRRDLADRYGADPERIRVVAPGVAEPGPAAPPERLAELGIDGRYVLHVGRV